MTQIHKLTIHRGIPKHIVTVCGIGCAFNKKNNIDLSLSRVVCALVQF